MAKPVDQFSIPSGRHASINASIWENENEKDGMRFTTYSVTIEKRFQKDGSWQSTSSFNSNELLVVAHLASKAYECVTQLRSQQPLPEET
jgi:hypothetical protein